MEVDETSKKKKKKEIKKRVNHGLDFWNCMDLGDSLDKKSQGRRLENNKEIRESGV